MTNFMTDVTDRPLISIKPTRPFYTAGLWEKRGKIGHQSLKSVIGSIKFIAEINTILHYSPRNDMLLNIGMVTHVW